MNILKLNIRIKVLLRHFSLHFFFLFLLEIPLKAFPAEALHLFKLQQTPCVCIFTSWRWYKTETHEHAWLIQPNSQICCCENNKKIKIQCLSSGVSFLFCCVATVSINHSGVVLCHSNPEVVKYLLLMLRSSSLRMCHYQSCIIQMDKNIGTVAPWHHKYSIWLRKKSQNCNMLCFYKDSKDKICILLWLWPEIGAGVFLCFSVWTCLSVSVFF